MPFVSDGGWGGTQCNVLWNPDIKRLAPVDRWTEIIYWMDVWMDGYMDGYMDRWMDGWMDGWGEQFNVSWTFFIPARLPPPELISPGANKTSGVFC